MEGLHSWGQFGLVGLMAGAVIMLLFIVVKWTLDTTKAILAQLFKQTEAFNEMQKLWNTAIDRHTDQAKAFHDEVKDAHKYQRDEHEKLQRSLDKTCDCLSEVEKSLGRINGYKA